MNPKYRNAISKIRTSSHTLEIERGRYTIPQTFIHDRKCAFCGVLEDENHFITVCPMYINDRNSLYSRIISKVPHFEHLNDIGKFECMLTNDDQQILSWFGKFIWDSFELRLITLRTINDEEI